MSEPKFKVGDVILVDAELLKGHLCEIVNIHNDGYIRIHHPTADWAGFYTGLSNSAQEKFNARKLTKLDKALK